MQRRNEREWDKWMDLKQHFDANRAAFPVDKLAPYMGQIVAWEPDGSAIREAAPSSEEVWEKIRVQGDDPSWYTYESLSLY